VKKLLIAGGTLTVAAASAATLITLTGHPVAQAPTPALRHAPVAPAAATVPVKRPTTVPGAAGVAHEGALGKGYEVVYALTGTANANTIPASGLTAANYLTVHPATEVTYTVVPGDELPPLLGDPALGRVIDTTVNRAPARLQLTANGFGTQRLEWLADGMVYTLLCDRLTTSDGVSGLTPDQLLAVARDVR